MTKGKVKVLVALFGFPIINQVYDLCDLLKEVGEACPLKKGPYPVGPLSTPKIPKDAPGVSACCSLAAAAMSLYHGELSQWPLYAGNLHADVASYRNCSDLFYMHGILINRILLSRTIGWLQWESWGDGSEWGPGLLSQRWLQTVAAALFTWSDWQWYDVKHDCHF